MQSIASSDLYCKHTDSMVRPDRANQRKSIISAVLGEGVAWQAVPLDWRAACDRLGKWPGIVGSILERLNGRWWRWRYQGTLTGLWRHIDALFPDWIGRTNFLAAWKALAGAGLVARRGGAWRCVTKQEPAAAPLGGIYFAQAGDEGPIKIGWSQDVERRMASLQVGCWVHVRLVATLPGRRIDEVAMHQRFAAARIRGEWFHHAPVLAWLEGQEVAA